MKKSLEKVSKFMSLLLRHKPETIGLKLDESGWALINELVELSRKTKNPLTKELIEKVVSSCDKQRYIISDDGLRVRANQGHSIKVELNLNELEPPEYLYHGTATRFLDSIMQTGLERRSRQFVHLSDNTDTATKVGSRHGKPVILKVESRLMFTEGAKFYLSENGVWLTEAVPKEMIVDTRER